MKFSFCLLEHFVSIYQTESSKNQTGNAEVAPRAPTLPIAPVNSLEILKKVVKCYHKNDQGKMIQYICSWSL